MSHFVWNGSDGRSEFVKCKSRKMLFQRGYTLFFPSVPRNVSIDKLFVVYSNRKMDDKI